VGSAAFSAGALGAAAQALIINDNNVTIMTNAIRVMRFPSICCFMLLLLPLLADTFPKI
jgi:hypothetical protein